MYAINRVRLNINIRNLSEGRGAGALCFFFVGYNYHHTSVRLSKWMGKGHQNTGKFFWNIKFFSHFRLRGHLKTLKYMQGLESFISLVQPTIQTMGNKSWQHTESEKNLLWIHERIIPPEEIWYHDYDPLPVPSPFFFRCIGTSSQNWWEVRMTWLSDPTWCIHWAGQCELVSYITELMGVEIMFWKFTWNCHSHAKCK